MYFLPDLRPTSPHAKLLPQDYVPGKSNLPDFSWTVRLKCNLFCFYKKVAKLTDNKTSFHS